MACWPRARRGRADVVRFGEPVGSHENSPPEDSRDAAGAGDPPPAANGLWAEFIRRSFGFDVLECPRCGGRLQLIAVIEDPAVIERILRHLGLPTDIPEAPARAAAPDAVPSRRPRHRWGRRPDPRRHPLLNASPRRPARPACPTCALPHRCRVWRGAFSLDTAP